MKKDPWKYWAILVSVSQRAWSYKVCTKRYLSKSPTGAISQKKKTVCYALQIEILFKNISKYKNSFFFCVHTILNVTFPFRFENNSLIYAVFFISPKSKMNYKLLARCMWYRSFLFIMDLRKRNLKAFYGFCAITCPFSRPSV